MGYSEVRGPRDTDLWKNLKAKISCQTPFNVEIGNEAVQFYSGNICFKFSVQYICSVELPEYHSVCPLVLIGTPLPSLPQASVAPSPSRNQRRDTLACGWRGGEVPIRTTGEKAYHSLSSVHGRVQEKSYS